MYRGAMRSILSELARLERLVICDDLKVDAPKTRDLAAQLNKFDQASILIVCDALDDNLALSARNLHNVQVLEARHLDPVSLVGYELVVMTSAAVKQVEEWLQ